MNTKDFPVIDNAEFAGIMIDAMRHEDGVYTAMFSFFTRFGDEVTKKKAEGFCWVTGVQGDNLLELYTKIDVMVELGLFAGIRVSAEGTLYDAQGAEVTTIDWNSFVDEDDDITEDIMRARQHTLH